MKILHTADIHLGELAGPIINGENARLTDTVKCMTAIENEALKNDVDVILIAGDLFHRSKLWADEMLKEITIASNWLRRLSNIAPTVLMFGTANHDNIKAFENIRKMDILNLTIATEPNLFKIMTNSGLVQIATVPGLDKGHYRTLFPGMDMEDENKAMSEALGNVILGLGVEANPSIPLILMSHYTVTGCELENGEHVYLNSDIIIPTATLAASNYDLVCLGHIHKAQSIPNCSRPVYYSGPPNAITFNEEGQDKGVWIHCLDKEFGKGSTHTARFVKTPSREFFTLYLDNNEVEGFILNGSECNVTVPPEVANKIVRVIYSCSSELNKQFSKKSLEKLIYDMGAFYVSEIRPEKIITTVDKNAMSENDSVEDNLLLWLDKQPIKESDIGKVIELSKPMIAQVSASLPTGKISGLFEPLRLAVKNYRSYLGEEFDFTKVSFATVNGPNGIGKSSFFMDAIADCLYEEPREGELTGWISNSDDVKSGAITFEFLMGQDKWRVVRTRAKSGKTTLALQKWNKDKWEDHSGDRKDQTQEKILNLLGMDAMTFKSCALIMQDNYGIFLEADKTDRMQVLSNILGLSIYDKLHVLTKEELKNENRKILKLKDDIQDIDTKLKEKDIQEDNLKNSLEEKAIASSSISENEKKLEEFKKQSEKLKITQMRSMDLTDKIKSSRESLFSKESERDKLQAELDRAKKIVDQEDMILAKIAEYEEAKTNITLLNARIPLLIQAREQMYSYTNETMQIYKKMTSNKNEISGLERSLELKEFLQKKVVELDELEEKLMKLTKDREAVQELSQKERVLRLDIERLQDSLQSKTARMIEQISVYENKVKLINNSNCPIENPTCNFLKDALEAKEKLPELKKELNNISSEELEKARVEYGDISEQLMKFDFSLEEYNTIENEVQELRKKKEELLSLSGKEELLNNHLKQQEELRKNSEELQEKKEKLEVQINDLEVYSRDLEELKEAMPRLEHWYKGKDELPAAKQVLVSASERIEVLKTEIFNLTYEIDNLQKEKTELIKIIDELRLVDSEINTSEMILRSLRTQLTNIEIAIGIAQAKLNEFSEMQDTRESKATELNALANNAKALEILVKAFSIDGIPFQIVRSVVAELSSQSNEILSQMTGGKMSIEFKMDKVLKNKKEINALEIWINDYQRGTMPYLSRSGGQKVKAALSVAFALADLKANRAGIKLGMMFIDEPPFLDTEGVQAYCDALELMHTRYPEMRVVAISHDPTMKARFPQEIEVIDAGESGSKILFN